MILHNSNLTKTSQGISFDGVIREAHICKGVMGKIYSATPKFKDGDFIESSEIVEVGFIPSIGHYVETADKSRYLIASTGYSACQKGLVNEDIKQKESHIKININYFKDLQWS